VVGTPATRVVPELEELSLFVSKHRKQQVAITQQLKAGQTISVPQFMLTGTQWLKSWHTNAKGYLRIDSSSKWICWPTGCVTAKCGRNTFSNKQIAKAMYKKVMKIPHATCARKIKAAKKERKVKRKQQIKERAAKAKKKEVSAKAMRVSKAREERASKKRRELAKKRLVIKLEKAAKARLERDNKRLAKIAAGYRKMRLERKQKKDAKMLRNLNERRSKINKSRKKVSDHTSVCTMTSHFFSRLRVMTKQSMSITSFTAVYLSLMAQYKKFYCDAAGSRALRSFTLSMRSRGVISMSMKRKRMSVNYAAFGKRGTCSRMALPAFPLV